jgi:hypothetical protein
LVLHLKTLRARRNLPVPEAGGSFMLVIDYPKWMKRLSRQNLKGSYEKVNLVSVEQILRAQEAVQRVTWMRK